VLGCVSACSAYASIVVRVLLRIRSGRVVACSAPGCMPSCVQSIVQDHVFQSIMQVPAEFLVKLKVQG